MVQKNQHEILLSGKDWKLMCCTPHEPWIHKFWERETMDGVYGLIPCNVPSSVQSELVNAKIIPDPYFELNSRLCEWTTYREYIYYKEFSVDKKYQGKTIRLHFEGVDHKCHVFVNGKPVGEHEGMYTTFEFNITDIVKLGEKNRLFIILDQAIEEMPQIGWTSKVRKWKARFAYQWDWSTRLIPIGIWDDVKLLITDDKWIKDVHVQPELNNELSGASVNVTTAVGGNNTTEVQLAYEISDDKNVIVKHVETVTPVNGIIKAKLDVSNPKLWYPNGHGDQPLYYLTVKLNCNNSQSDEKTVEFGFRKLRMVNNDGAAADALPYVIEINNKKIFVKGWNWVPMDQMYGSVPKDKYEHFVLMAKKANCNLFRVWGGGLIEKEWFYHYCNKYGIMVWQEFIQSSSGIDNFPPVDDEYLKMVEDLARQIVPRRRNNPALVIWCGGNELCTLDNVPLNNDYPTIKVLKSVVDELDPDKCFLATSPTGPVGGAELKHVGTGKMHDVHGPWNYQGIDDHYKFYNTIDPLFHSEFGTEGAAVMSTIERTVSKKNVWPPNTTNEIWRHHGLWWVNKERLDPIFGKTDNMPDFVRTSHFLHAEGLRYAIESNRRRKWHTSGTNMWQYNESWPNLSCTNAIDYYGMPKPVFWWIKRAYEPVHVSAKYATLNWADKPVFEAEVWINNSLNEPVTDNRVEITVVTVSGKVLLTKTEPVTVDADSGKLVTAVKADLPKGMKEIFLLCLRLKNSAGKLVSANDYVFSTYKPPVFKHMLKMPKTKIKVQKSGKNLVIKNTGSSVAMLIELNPVKDDLKFWLSISNNYLVLLPGEEQTVNLGSYTGRYVVKGWNCKS
jgi:beta-mannosidase